MTISHFIVKYGTRAKGDSAVSNYQNLVGLENNPEKEDLEYLEHHNYPSWAKSYPKICKFGRGGEGKVLMLIKT